jgi:hypothetical protein
MTDATTAYRNGSLPQGRIFAGGSGRKIARRFGLASCIGLGIALAACLLVMTVIFVAAGVLRLARNANPHLSARATFAVAAQPADVYPGSIAAIHLADLPRMTRVEAESIAALNALTFDARPVGVAASAFIPRAADDAALQRPLVASPSAPSEIAYAAAHELAGFPEVMQAAAFAVMPDVDPGGAPPLPRQRPKLLRPPDQSAANLALTTGSIPEGGVPSRTRSAGRTAVYDITAQTVYMPNGERLEAHSGLGEKMDDPRYVRVRMQGPTPPNVYRLTLREKLFHGVRAVRLNPVDEGKMFGRDGMLAHTYLLGPNGQSNGCVSFKDYPRFLRAFLRGEVDRLVVVATLGNESWQAVAARGGPAPRFADNDH